MTAPDGMDQQTISKTAPHNNPIPPVEDHLADGVVIVDLSAPRLHQVGWDALCFVDVQSSEPDLEVARAPVAEPRHAGLPERLDRDAKVNAEKHIHVIPPLNITFRK